LPVIKIAVPLQSASPKKKKGRGRRERGSVKFFESLRPAQDLRRGSAAREKEPLKGTLERTSRRNPRYREKFE